MSFRGSKSEFRVVWQREGRRRQTAIFQSWEAACHKFAGIVATDQAKAGTRMDTLPDLVGVPVIEVRRCEPWQDNEFQPDPTPREHVVGELHFSFDVKYGRADVTTEVPF